MPSRWSGRLLTLASATFAAGASACGLLVGDASSVVDAAPDVRDAAAADSSPDAHDARALDARDANDAAFDQAAADASDASADDLLRSLTVSVGSLSPFFAPSTLAYTATVDPMVASLPGGLTFTPTTDDPSATVTVNGAVVASGTPSAPIPLVSPPSPVAIVVTAANGATLTYRVQIVTPTLSVGGTAVVPTGPVPDAFGYSVAIDGDTLVVGAPGDSDAVGVGLRSETPPGTPADAAPPTFVATQAGAAFVFHYDGTAWTQAAVLHASNATPGDGFGAGVAIVGGTIVVGAPGESSPSTGVNGSQSGTSAYSSGAAYVFTGGDGTWTQAAYLKAAVNARWSSFGDAVALTPNPAGGLLLAVGAPNEQSAATGVNGDASDTTADGAGAAYVFAGSGDRWSQEAYLKASNTRPYASFGSPLSFSGSTLAVGAVYDWSAAEGVNGNGNAFPEPEDWWNDLADAGALVQTPPVITGAVYVFVGDGASPETWSQQAFIKGSLADLDNSSEEIFFGQSLALQGDLLAVGVPCATLLQTTSASVLAGGDNPDGGPPTTAWGCAGAVSLFERTGQTWARSSTVYGAAGDLEWRLQADGGAGGYPQAPLFASNFGSSVAIRGASVFGSAESSSTPSVTATTSTVTELTQGGAGAWTESTIFTPTTALPGFGGFAYFPGGGMAISGTHLALTSGQGAHQNAAYVYEVP